MRTALVTAEIVGATLLMLVLISPPAWGQSMGELSAVQGIQGTLARQGTGSGRAARDTVNRSLASSPKPRKELDFGSPRQPGPPRLGSVRKGGSKGSHGGGRGSWVTAESGRGRSNSSSWQQGGNGWESGRQPTRRKRS